MLILFVVTKETGEMAQRVLRWKALSHLNHRQPQKIDFLDMINISHNKYSQ